jgi:hypothetical protein
MMVRASSNRSLLKRRFFCIREEQLARNHAFQYGIDVPGPSVAGEDFRARRPGEATSEFRIIHKSPQRRVERPCVTWFENEPARETCPGRQIAHLCRAPPSYYVPDLA